MKLTPWEDGDWADVVDSAEIVDDKPDVDVLIANHENREIDRAEGRQLRAESQLRDLWEGP